MCLCVLPSYHVNMNMLLGGVTRKLKWADGAAVRAALEVRQRGRREGGGLGGRRARRAVGGGGDGCLGAGVEAGLGPAVAVGVGVQIGAAGQAAAGVVERLSAERPRLRLLDVGDVWVEGESG